jgi:hypothetical protein
MHEVCLIYWLVRRRVYRFLLRPALVKCISVSVLYPGSPERGRKAARDTPPFPPCRQPPAPRAIRFKEPSEAVFAHPPGPRFNGSMMRRANHLRTQSSARSGRVRSHVASSPRTHAPPLRSRSALRAPAKMPNSYADSYSSH